jgi:5'-deoxynucleotidase YfbR-like HD superfamily hydrolase
MINEIRSGFHVKRFHTTHRTQEETVGHHSANVAAIILRLDPAASRNLLVAALMHDVPEVYTGDVPAPFKWDYPAIKLGLGEGEMAYMEENEIPYPDDLTDQEVTLLKVADMVDLVLSSLEEMGRGNRYARELVQNGQWYLLEMDLPIELQQKITTMVKEVKDKWQLTTSN